MMSETTLTFGGMEEYLAAQIGREVIAEFRCGFENPPERQVRLQRYIPASLSSEMK